MNVQFEKFHANNEEIHVVVGSFPLHWIIRLKIDQNVFAVPT